MAGLGLINKMTSSKLFQELLYKPAMENPAKFAGRMALLSALTKDAVNTYYYVTQSLNNDKIPEDKRGFVASLDLMNGILNVGLQFTIGAWLDKKAPDIFNSLIGKRLDKINTRKVAQALEGIIKKTHPNSGIGFEQIEKFLRTKVLGSGGKATRWLNIGFTAAMMLIATQVISKRIFTPLLATPMAGWYKEHVLDKHKKKKDPVLDHVTSQIIYANNKPEESEKSAQGKA